MCLEQVPGFQFLGNKQAKEEGGRGVRYTRRVKSELLSVFSFLLPFTHQGRSLTSLTSTPTYRKHIFKPCVHSPSLQPHLQMRMRKDIVVTSIYCLITVSTCFNKFIHLPFSILLWTQDCRVWSFNKDSNSMGGGGWKWNPPQTDSTLFYSEGSPGNRARPNTARPPLSRLPSSVLERILG